MIGIYQDNFIDYLRERLGSEPKITAKNIIVPCPWCEYQEDKDHYHLYIGLDIPIFNCFGPDWSWCMVNFIFWHMHWQSMTQSMTVDCSHGNHVCIFM